MRIAIGMENNVEGRSLAWALDYSGCFAYGQDEGEALMRLPRALINYAARIDQHAAEPWVQLGDFDLRLVETWNVYTINEQYERAAGDYEVNAWFQHDWKPLTAVEIEHGLQMLRWNREDLLGIASGLTPEQLDQTYPGERWSIRGILGHIGGSEWWYLSRLDLAGPSADLPEDAFARLEQARARMEAVLPTLAGQEMVRGKYGEFWSPRKLLRRALWHEMDHIEHILKLLLGSPA